MFQVSPASLQTFVDKLNCVHKAHVQYNTVQAASVVFDTQVRGFAPGRSRRIFRAKISSARLHSGGGGGVKPSVPCRSFTACKRSINVTWKLAFRQNLPDISRPQFHLPPLGAVAW